MAPYVVSISAGDTLLWSARVEASSAHDAKTKALHLMQTGGGFRPKIGHPPPGPFNVKVERSKLPVGWS
jgi:hypothetical protein